MDILFHKLQGCLSRLPTVVTELGTLSTDDAKLEWRNMLDGAHILIQMAEYLMVSRIELNRLTISNRQDFAGHCSRDYPHRLPINISFMRVCIPGNV